MQGTVSLVQGGGWLQVGDASSNGQCAIKTTQEQQIPLVVDTRTLAAAQSYVAKLRVVTNGGVVEVPVGFDLEAQAFSRGPFQGARKPRDMAEKMRDNPKAAVPLLETGELSRWFASNNWNYPVRGTPAKGVAGVQQFFEAMGLSKPPALKLSHPGVKLTCTVPETPRAKVTLFTNSKKYVYANVTSDVPWLNVLTPDISGPQKAELALQVEPRELPPGPMARGALQLICNGGKRLQLPVIVEVQRPASSLSRKLVQPIFTLALVFLLLRLIIVPFADFYARHAATNAALEKSGLQSKEVTRSYGDWLSLPWVGIMLGQSPKFPKFVVDDPQLSKKKVVTFAIISSVIFVGILLY